MSKLNLPPFTLGETITPEQRQFFNKNGVIVFRNFIHPETVKLFISEVERIEKEWLAEGRDKVNGVPLKFGQDEGRKPNDSADVLSVAAQQCASRIFAGPTPAGRY